jgi:cupin fold WbuC family metalloprotein
MKDKETIPNLSQSEIEGGVKIAYSSNRKRHHKILHQQGSEFNEVFNFMMKDTYMQPHMHPGEEKIEDIHIIQGKLAIIFFDDDGCADQIIRLEKNNQEHIEVPAFTWHTYVMLTDSVVTYETMMGKYDPDTWKKMATWAPEENINKSISYLKRLKQQVSGFNKFK